MLVGGSFYHRYLEDEMTTNEKLLSKNKHHALSQAPIFGRVLSKGFFPIRASNFNSSFVVYIISLKGINKQIQSPDN